MKNLFKKLQMPVVLFLFVLLVPGLCQAKSLLIPFVSLEASLKPEKNLIEGKAEIKTPPGQNVSLNLSGLKVKKFYINGKRISSPEPFINLSPSNSPQHLKIEFSARFTNLPNIISERAIVLTGNWFPSVEGLAHYDIKITLPKRFVAIAPSDEIKIKSGRKNTYHFVFKHPQERPPLVAGPYFTYQEKYKNLTLAVYLFEENVSLAQAYLNQIKKTINEYESLIGPYPYRRFAVVENIFQTGYAFPTFTLIGSRLLPLPFIRETSLPHEILHNWFGCGVYVDWSKGNWSEGLVTYLADHRLAEKKGEGALYRHRLLVNYQSYVTPERDFPLKMFIGRKDRASQAIGYGKGALFFHMLRQKLGDKAFFDGLKLFYQENLFKYASWEDIKKAFEKETNSNLHTFFSEWLERTGLPKLNLVKERVIPLKNDEYLVALRVTQEKPYYQLSVPVEVISEKETKSIQAKISGPQARLDVKIKGKPLKAVLDQNYDLARILTEPEFPPVLARLFGRKGFIVVPSQIILDRYKPLVSFLEKRGYILSPNFISPDEVTENIVYLDTIPEKYKNLFPQAEGNFYLLTVENPENPSQIIALAQTTSTQEIQRVLHKLEHLGRYQGICSNNGVLTTKIEPTFEKGIKVNLDFDVKGLALKELNSIESIARAVSLKKVIFLGERHDRYEQHLAQLEIIKWLHEHGRPIAIGLEMFQRPFQQALDDYIAGRIGEDEFLRQSEYFKRWGYNWKLYKPIIDYARENKIPLVALNAPKEITDKVAKEGLGALSPEEKAQIPEIDRQNLAYQEFLRFVFEHHENSSGKIKNFETFYEAQLVWDETMAQSIVNYLEKHPDKQMVVLVGSGHVVYGYGIPSRVARRGIKDYAIILLGPEEALNPAMADYVLFPEPKEAPFAAKLGVLIEEKPNGLLIKKVFPDTPAKKAGLKEGDVIIKADKQDINDLADLKAILAVKKPDDHVLITILRKGKAINIKVGPFKTKNKSEKLAK
ncbi:ChaN family lipoprotein [Thermodesulfatator indicus]